MEKLLPIPTIEHIPPYDRAEALCNKMDSIFLGIQKDIISLKNILDPFACPSGVLNVFARFLNANCKETDSEDIKRHRIWSAIEDNKLFGTWQQIKRTIDSICGGDSQIVFSVPDDIWILLGDGGIVDAQIKETWAVFGIDENSAQTNLYGIALDGVPTLWQKGVFNIDVDNDHLTQSEINLLYETLFPTTPVGMTIAIGYLVGTELVPYFILGEVS